MMSAARQSGYEPHEGMLWKSRSPSTEQRSRTMWSRARCSCTTSVSTLGLTGTNIGCDTSSCGACTIHLNGEAVKSCTVLAVQADGQEVRTIEGLAGRRRRCTRCSRRSWRTTGCSAVTARPAWSWRRAACSLENPHPTEEDVRLGLEGNLCRCTGYHNIVKSVLAARRPDGDGTRPPPLLWRHPVIPAAFDYVRAESAEEAISLVGEHGDEAKFIAGGHSLLPMMKLRLAQPSVLIDIGRLTDLSYIRDGGDHIAIGALTRHMDIETSALLAGARAAAGARRRPGRRPAGPPPRHHRRLDRPRRSRLRPARPPRSHSAPPTSPRARTAPARSPPPTSTRRSSSRPWPPTRSSPRSASPSAAAPAGASRSSTAVPRTGRSSVWPPGAATARPASALVNMGATPVLATSVASAPVERFVDRRGCRTGHRRGVTAGRPQRQRRVPRAPRQGPHAACSPGRHRLNGAVNAATTRGSEEDDGCTPGNVAPDVVSAHRRRRTDRHRPRFS